MARRRKKGSHYRDSRPAALRFGVEKSLRRLRIETIDLLQIHWPDPDTPISETVGELIDKALAETVTPIARSHGATVVQTMLSWVIARNGITSALVGIRSEVQINENVRIVETLSADEIDEIAEVFSGLRVRTNSILSWLKGLR